MHAHGALQNKKKMAIEVHNATAPVADDAVFGLPKWGIAMRSGRPASSTTQQTACVAEERGEIGQQKSCRRMRRRRRSWPWMMVAGRGGVGDISEPRIIQWRAEGGYGAGDRAGSRKQKKKRGDGVD